MAHARPVSAPLTLTLHDSFLPGPNRTTSPPPKDEAPTLYQSILAIDVHKLRVDGGVNLGRFRLDGALIVENDFPAVSAKISMHSGLKSFSVPIPMVQFMPERVGTASGWIVQMRLFQRDF